MELSINKNEVLRYLGYHQQELGSQIVALIQECIEQVRTLVIPKSIYKTFNIKRNAAKLDLQGSTLKLQGQDILSHLDQAESCVLMAVTLGSIIDTKIRYYSKTNMTKALILDACASVAVEEIANKLCQKLNGELNKQGKQLTSRYSPGYGDFPLESQKDFIAVLKADRSIGLHVSAHSILIPRKSITAVAGVVNKGPMTLKKTCLDCGQFEDCQLRKDNEEYGC